ncbi:hypothetical protein ACSBOB_18650 [Mesorhizobium sp. ASY16-5R]|uniref:hypothetical protein n=1 Tax=Mesorhizobium sp. ASY16-5R TaxID=3445772 RepID=UPI003F9FE660
MNLAQAYTDRNEFGETETNDVVIRSYTTMGTVEGFGKVSILAREAVVPDRKMALYFVGVQVESSDQYPQTRHAAIQFDNVEKFLRAIDRLEKAVITTDRFAFSEIEYDVDGLKVVVFNDGRGKIMFVVTVGGVSVHFPSMSQLADLRGLIRRGYEHLRQHKVEF